MVDTLAGWRHCHSVVNLIDFWAIFATILPKREQHLNARSFQHLVKNLQLFYKCPMCGAGYRHDDIKFLGQVDNHCFMQLNCHSCSVPVLATVFLSDKDGEQFKPVQPPISGAKSRRMTDLKPREKTRFMAKGEIGSAEIAELYLFLTKYDGNLSHISR